LAGSGTLVASQHGRGGSYTLQGNYASYYYNAGVSEDVNYNTVTITLKVNAYIDGTYKSAGGTYSFTIGSGYSMPSHIVTPA
jgi:hypothetical protein